VSKFTLKFALGVWSVAIGGALSVTRRK